MKPRKLSVINEAIFHKNDSPYAKHDVKFIEDWHSTRFNTPRSMAPKGKYKYCGYHFVILFDGTIQVGRLMEYYGQHTGGRNGRSIGVCFQGTAETEITEAQIKAAQNLLIKLRDKCENLRKASQHSDYSKAKPHCAGLGKSQLKFLNQVLL